MGGKDKDDTHIGSSCLTLPYHTGINIHAHISEQLLHWDGISKLDFYFCNRVIFIYWIIFSARWDGSGKYMVKSTNASSPCLKHLPARTKVSLLCVNLGHSCYNVNLISNQRCLESLAQIQFSMTKSIGDCWTATSGHNIPLPPSAKYLASAALIAVTDLTHSPIAVSGGWWHYISNIHYFNYIPIWQV